MSSRRMKDIDDLPECLIEAIQKIAMMDPSFLFVQRSWNIPWTSEKLNLFIRGKYSNDDCCWAAVTKSASLTIVENIREAAVGAFESLLLDSRIADERVKSLFLYSSFHGFHEVVQMILRLRNVRADYGNAISVIAEERLNFPNCGWMQNNEGLALLLAVANGHERVVKTLLEWPENAPKVVRDYDLIDPILIAIKKGHGRILKLLGGCAPLRRSYAGSM